MEISSTTLGASSASLPVLKWRPLLEFLFIGGASLLVYAIFAGAKVAPGPLLYSLSGGLVWVVNWPHFGATLVRLYGAPENRNRYPVTAYFSPFLVLAGIVGSFASPALVAPCFVKFFLFWSSYHYSGQSRGLTLLYLKRSGVELSRVGKFALSALLFGSFIQLSLWTNVGAGGFPYYEIQVPSFDLPRWMAWIGDGVMWTGGAVFLFELGRILNSRRIYPQLLALTPTVALLVWFKFAQANPAFQLFVPLFHSLQYLWVAGQMQLQETSDQASPLGLQGIGRLLPWAAASFVVGALLFYGLPYLGVASGFNLAFATGVIIAGVQIHHFLVDGIIWKLRVPRISSRLVAGALAIVALSSFAFPRSSLAATTPQNVDYVVFHTTVGDLVFRMYPEVAPKHVERIVRLAKIGAYDAVPVIRIEKSFVIQFAPVEARQAPTTPEIQKEQGIRLPAEFSALVHRRGILSMARYDDDVNSASSSFSILLAPAPHLDGKYTIFGELVGSEDVLRYLERMPVDSGRRPEQPVMVSKAEVLKEEQLASLKRVGPPAMAPMSARPEAPKYFVLALTAVIVAMNAVAIAWARIRSSRGLDAQRVLRSASMATILVCVFGAYLSLRSIGASVGWVGGLIFLASIAAFRMMNEFEVESPVQRDLAQAKSIQ